MDNKIINFYEGPYALLSNFSSHQVVLNGEEYATAEHAYQAAKFSDHKIREKIKKAKSAFSARELGQGKEGRKEAFDKVAVMKEVMQAKLLQHVDVRDTLMETGTREIFKNHRLDSYWGTGSDGKGQNMMGKIWMELRAEIRKDA